MLSNEDIENYKQLQKEVADANIEKQTMKAEIQVLRNQGIEKLQKWGLKSFSDIPKLKEKLESLEKRNARILCIYCRQENGKNDFVQRKMRK